MSEPGLETGPEIKWVEVKRPCKDCPTRDNDSKKEQCIHPWRVTVESRLAKHGNRVLSMCEVVSFWDKGASISSVSTPDKRPSVQTFDAEPPVREGFLKIAVRQEPS